MILLGYLILLSYVDIRTMYINPILQVLLIIFLQISIQNIYVVILLVSLFLILDYLKPNQMGGADMKIFIILSLEFGKNIFLIIMLSSMYAIIYTILTQKKNDKIPFIPFITLGVITCQILIH